MSLDKGAKKVLIIELITLVKPEYDILAMMALMAY